MKLLTPILLLGASIATATAAPTVFEARGLRKVYHTGEVDVVALHGVDVQFHEGELVVLLGAGDITQWAYALPGQLEVLA